MRLLLQQAFTADELTTAKSRVQHLDQLQTTLNEAWRQVRWSADVIAQARDRSGQAGLLQLRTLFDGRTTTTTTTAQEAAACEDVDSCRPSLD